MPHHTGEMLPPRDVVQEMRDNGIRAAKMYPRSHHYFFNEDTCGGLLSAFEEEEIPPACRRRCNVRSRHLRPIQSGSSVGA